MHDNFPDFLQNSGQDILLLEFQAVRESNFVD